MILDFVIAVGPKGGTYDRTFEGLQMPYSVYWVATPNAGPKILNLPNMVKTKQMGTLLVAIDVLSARIYLFS